MIRACLVLAVALSVSEARAQAPTALSCTGPFARQADEAALKAAFGAANVTREELDAAEGSTEPGNVLFAKDPKKRVEIFWHDVKKRRQPASIIVRDESVWTVAGEGAKPISLGKGLAEVEALNGGPFDLFGFEWDMGGYSAGWRSGKLDKLAGGCSLSLRFSPDEKARPAVLNKVSGDKRFRSSDPAMRAAKPTISVISLGWAQP